MNFWGKCAINGCNKDASCLKFEDGKDKKNYIIISLCKEHYDDFQDAELQKLYEKHKSLLETLSQVQTQIKSIHDQVTSIHMPEREKIQEIIAQHRKEIEAFSQEAATLKKNLEELKKKLEQAEKSERKFRDDYTSLFHTRNNISDALRKSEGLIGQEDFKQREIEKKINEVHLQRAKAVAELEALQAEFEPYIGTKLRRNISAEKLKREIGDFEKLLKEMGSVNMRALDLYDVILKEFDDLLAKKEAHEKEKTDVLAMMADDG